MLVIGVTGGVGTGKSTVARMFGRWGAVVLDADRIAREVIEPNTPGWRAVKRVFGTVDRGRLAAVVFSDARRRRQLERIIHPRVMREIRRRVRLARARRAPAAVLDVPLLVEVGVPRFIDALVVVTAPPAAQRRRIRRQRGWSQEEIDARIRAQWKLSAKVALADYVVDNSDGVAATQTQVNRIWKQLVQANSSPRSKSSTSQR